MKHLALAFLIGVATAPSFAGPCVVLDYQEMKEMSVDELSKEYCNAGNARMASMDDILINLRTSEGAKPFPNAHDNFDQCTGQLERIERVMSSKGIAKEAMKTICTRRVTDTSTQAPIESR